MVTWTGPFKTPTGTNTCGGPDNAACDNFRLSIVPPSFSFNVDIKLQPLLVGDWDLEVYGPDGQLVLGGTSGHSAGVQEEVLLHNPAAGTYTVTGSPFSPAPGDPSYTASATIVAAPNPPPGTEPVTYLNYVPPFPLGRDAGEPSGGISWKSDRLMTIAGLQTLRTTFDDCSSPARDAWQDVTFPLTGTASADPILFTDPVTGRTFVSQLAGETSLMAFTDDDGVNWTPNQGAGVPSGVDHQSVGGGRFHDPLTRDPSGPLYPHAVYYCSQAAADAFCARSDDGGLTFNQGVPIYTAVDCGGLHGHVKVAPDDGTIYVPNKNCQEQAVIVNETNGEALPPGWVIRRVPGSSGGYYDSSVAIDSAGTVFFGYGDGDGHPRVAVSHDKGANWVNITDVGIPAGLQNTAFPAMVAGSAGRAAFAFLGTTTAGDPSNSDTSWPGVWYLYVAHTYDGGVTWTTVNATPNDPVQRGMICNKGLNCTGARNLLDFNDAQVDREGRVVVIYADGCGGSCIQGPPNSGTALLTVARQVNGKRMFAQFDNLDVPAAPLATGSLDPSNNTLVHISWSTPDDHGSPITGYSIYRRTSTAATFSLLASVGPDVHAYDDTIDPSQGYFYRVTAVNAVGEGLPCGQFCINTPSCAEAPSQCTPPGLPVVTDPPGDVSAPGSNQQDILSISAAGILLENGPPRIVLTMKVDNLNSPPANTAWRIYWTSPNAIMYFVDMDTFTPNQIQFNYGTFDGTIFTNVGTADAGSFSADGTIEITIATAKVGSPTPGQTLTSITGETQLLVGVVGNGALVALDTTGSGDNTLAGCTSGRPDAVDDLASTPFNTPVVIEVLANDTDPQNQPLTIVGLTQPVNGSAANNGDGTVTYTPNANFHGVDVFTYTISDPDGNTDTATVTVIVGECTLDPTFAGIQSVSAPAQASCSLDLSWIPATNICPGQSVRYNVYRSENPSFTPSPANAIALRVNGLSYRDQVYLSSGVTYYYIVRAEDSTTSNGGPGNGGNEDNNLVRLSGTPVGPLVPAPDFSDDVEPTSEAGYSVFTTRTVGAWAVMVDPTAHSLTHAWVVPDDQPGVPTLTPRNDTLTLPPMNLSSSSVLTFWHNFDFARFPEIPNVQSLAYESGGILEISADGNTWTDLGADGGGNLLPYIAPSYNGTISSTATNPLINRKAWVGSSDGDNVAGRGDAMQQVTVNLGQAIQDLYSVTSLPGARIRFRMGGTFQILIGGIQGSGWGVDDITVTGLEAPGQCATPPTPSGRVETLREAKATGDDITLSWGTSCVTTDTDYEIYEGTLPNFYSHTSRFCSTDNLTTATLTPSVGNTYYLIVAKNALREGSYGARSGGIERPQGTSACLPQQIGPCP